MCYIAFGNGPPREIRTPDTQVRSPRLESLYTLIRGTKQTDKTNPNVLPSGGLLHPIVQGAIQMDGFK